jgi:hypothetical protein
VSGTQFPSLQNALDRKVQRIQVRRKWRPEPQIGVSKILGLQAKVHSFSLGAVVYSGGALAPSPGVGMAASETAGGRRCLWRRRRRNLHLNVVIFGDFRRFRRWLHPRRRQASSKRTGGRRRPMEWARAPPSRTRVPPPKRSCPYTSTGANLDRTTLQLGLLHHS